MQEFEGGAVAALEGLIHISEDVIVELTRKTIQGIPNIQLAGTRFAAKFGLGRKSGDGIRVSVQAPDLKAFKSQDYQDHDEDSWGEPDGGDDDESEAVRDRVPLITIDAYVLVRYGKRIPDLAWDVQEKVKNNLERYTGYIVKSVNINVQGIYVDEPIQLEHEPESKSESELEEQHSEVLKGDDRENADAPLEVQDMPEHVNQEQSGGNS